MGYEQEKGILYLYWPVFNNICPWIFGVFCPGKEFCVERAIPYTGQYTPVVPPQIA